MKRENISNFFGISLLLICFTIALVRVFSRDSEKAAESGELIRFAHWQLEGGIREAFDQIAREYEALHPGVRVEQVAVPERTYAQWLRTQLIGGTATDIIELGKNMDDELLARFFVPISDYVEQPNPYNRGTELENVVWRESIIDGMQAGFNYRPNLLEYYGAPVSMFTIRIYYNRELWKELLGDLPTPKTYDEFQKICARVAEIGASRQILPIAGSKENGPMLTEKLFSNQTQRLVQSLDVEHGLKVVNTDVGLAYLQGRWNVDNPAYADALTLARDIGRYMQPGFIQLGREDATFYFIQGRALMITTGSWDSSSFRAQATFDIGVFKVPTPERDHPRFGRNVFGVGSELEAGTGLSFGLVRQSPHFDRALDFLQFLTSKRGNTTFSRVSGWLPSVVGVEPPEHVKPFLPTAKGYVDGFGSKLASLGADSTRAIDSNFNLLVGQAGSVEAFQKAVKAQLPRSIRQDLYRSARNTLLNVSRQDVILAAQTELAGHGMSAETSRRKISELLEAQNLLESKRAWTLHELTRLPAE